MNILLIDKRVQDYETVVAAIDPALAVGVVFDYYEDTLDTVKTRMRQLVSVGNSIPIAIGLIQHNYKAPMFTMLASADVAPVAQVATQDPDLAAWTQFRDFIAWCNTEFNAAYFDMMACALYSDPDWKYVIDTLTTQTGVTVRASSDDTGAASLGGDWFLESHTGVNLKDIYFTDLIDDFHGILYNTIWINTSEQQLKSMSPGRAILWGDTNTSYPTNPNYNSNSNLQSGIISIYTSGNNGHWSALKTDGTVVSSHNSGNLVTKGGQTLTNVVAIYSNQYGFAGLTSTGRVATWGTGSQYETEYYDSDYHSVTSRLQSGCVDVFSQPNSFVALKSDGTTVAWGQYMRIAGVNITGTSGQFSCANHKALCVGYLITISGTFSGTGAISGYVNPTIYKISSITKEYYGSVVGFTLTTLTNEAITTTPGTTTGLTYSNDPFDGHNNIVTIVSNNFSYAALKSNGSVVVWGQDDKGGDTSITIASGPYAGNTVQSQLNSNVVSLYASTNGFAALKSNGDFIFWRNVGGTGSDTNVVYAIGARAGIYALKANGGIIGFDKYSNALSLPSGFGSVNQAVGSNVIAIYATELSISVLKRDGSVFVYGDSTDGAGGMFYVDGNNVVDLYSGGECMAALKTNGSLITWGKEGGNSSSASSFLSSNIVAAYPAGPSYGDPARYWCAMLALNNSGEVKAWGKSDRGGLIPASIASDVSSGIIAVYSSGLGYYVIKSTASTFDLSASYYRPIDRYNILCKKNNRRRANLKNLNNNVFTLSNSYDLSKINPSIPSNKTLSIIVPDYSASLSVSSTATLPDTSGNFIIACEECEPIIISGSRYINYGSYVYNDSSSNFIKLTAATINSREYTLYGGSGGNKNSSSGIVFLEVILENSTFSTSTFTIASSKTFGDASFNNFIRPTSNSSGAITYSSRNTAVATIDASGNFITIVGAGDVSFNATQASTSQYASATITSNTLTVARGTSTLSASSFEVAPSKTLGDASFSFSALPTSNNTSVAITYSSSNINVATVDASGTTITLVAAGDVSFNATQPQTAQYESATKTSNTLTVLRGTTSLTSFSVADSKTFGDLPFSITAPTTASSGAITYSSNATGVATINPSSGIITLVAAGTATFTASQAQSAQYNAPTPVTSNTLTVSLATPTLSSTTFSVASSKTFGDASFNNFTRPTSNSSGAITYTSSNPAVATIDPSGTWITILSAGDVSFNASQAAVEGRFISATKTSNTMTVSLGTPTLSSTTFLVASSKTFGDASFNNFTRPTSNSDGVITYTSSNTAVATIDPSGTWITILSAGDVSFNASQAATSQYASATKASNTLTVSLATPTLSSTTFSVASNKTFGDASFNNFTRPTSNSSGAITYSSSNPAVATIDASGNFITLVGSGDVSFNATQAQTTQYTGATKTSNTLTVERGTTTLARTAMDATISKTFGIDISFNVVATSDSSGAVTYTSSAPQVATVGLSTGLVTPVSAGQTTITAQQAQSAQYNVPTSITSVLTVLRGTTSLSSFSVAGSKTFGAAPFSIDTAPTSASSGAITYSSDASGVAIITSRTGIITLVAAGTATFTASQAQSAQYNAPTPVTSNTLTVSKVTPTLVFVNPPASKSLTDAAFTVTATSGILFSVSNSGSGAYVINGSSNPTLTVIRGMRYILSVNASGHPFWIQTVSGAYSGGNIYSNSSIVNNGEDVGNIIWEVAFDTPTTLYYACQYHSSMQGVINVV